MPWAKEINIIRGKSLMYPAEYKADVQKVFEYIDLLEEGLDELDLEDALGTEGWRFRLLGED